VGIAGSSTHNSASQVPGLHCKHWALSVFLHRVFFPSKNVAKYTCSPRVHGPWRTPLEGLAGLARARQWVVLALWFTSPPLYRVDKYGQPRCFGWSWGLDAPHLHELPFRCWGFSHSHVWKIKMLGWVGMVWCKPATRSGCANSGPPSFLTINLSLHQCLSIS